MELIRTFDTLSRRDLPLAGGKGANLGAMVQAGLPVPPGFVVLTEAYRAFVQQAGIQPEIERLARAADAASQESLDDASARIRALFDGNPVPGDIGEAIARAYEELGGGAVAVRSSATAEDLPDASFAGQQETYLNISGADQVVLAVRRCWSSLWTGRALAYRLRNGIGPADVALAAVVQRLVAADVAGVLFTADPITGHRGRMVIDGAWGLGESVVSGIVSPDNWVADGKTGAVLKEQIAAKMVMTVRTERGTEERPVPPERQRQPVLESGQVAALVELGRRTADYFGVPQDVEWAMAEGQFYLLQSRPITTLFPLPQPAPPPDAGLRFYVTLQGMQGVMEPLTPVTFAVFRSVAASAPRAMGLKLSPDEPAFVAEAGGRLYIDVTGLLRLDPVRKAFSGEAFDAAMGQALRDVLASAADRLGSAKGGGRLPVWRLATGQAPTMVRRALRGLVAPERAREETRRQLEAYVQGLDQQSRQLAGMQDRVRFVDQALNSLFTGIITRTVPLWLAGSAALSLAGRRLEAWGVEASQLDAVGRSVAHNPTTEMDLALWRVSRELLAAGERPSADHPAVLAWLQQYGHRAVREIDVGIPRWREDPDHVLHLLATYSAQATGAADPEHRFEKGAAEAADAIAAITDQVRRKRGAGRAAFIRLLLHRYRQLGGVREWHKFYLIHVLAIVRRVLSEGGGELIAAGRLERADDVFFLDLGDLASGRDLREIAARNHARYLKDMQRRPIPLAMTSEGEVSYGIRPAQDGVLVGAGASAGVHEGVVRVILNPLGAQLEPGEVLVAPATDPAWTPLFLTAGALVTETGGMISHGSVVAREYGIPAVVGAAGATTRLRTGQRVRVDGTAGTVAPLE